VGRARRKPPRPRPPTRRQPPRLPDEPRVGQEPAGQRSAADPALNTWYVRDRYDEQRGRWVVRAFRGPRYPDGVVVDDAEPELDAAEPLWMAAADLRGRTLVSVSQRVVPNPPHVWFVELSDRPDHPDEAQLVAFASEHLPAGTVIDRFAFTTVGVRNEEQVAAVKWRPSTGVVLEVYVHPQQRRQQLATLVLYAASAVHQSRGWSGALRSDGRRTDLGERFVTGLAHPQRIAPWKERAAPMDPDATERPAGRGDDGASEDPAPDAPPRRRPRWLGGRRG
jgi:GNAT superfamily N-acetyltransferase